MGNTGVRLSPKQVQELNDDIFAKEIEDAVFTMGPTKAPGLDGFLARFFKKYWDVVGVDVINFVQKIFKATTLIEGINCTFLILIPK